MAETTFVCWGEGLTSTTSTPLTLSLSGPGMIKASCTLYIYISYSLKTCDVILANVNGAFLVRACASNSSLLGCHCLLLHPDGIKNVKRKWGIRH